MFFERQGSIMLKKIENTMREHGMINTKSILVGLSGGADSVVLTHALCMLSEKYGYKLYAAHVNHGLRAADAQRDEEFSKELAEKLGIGFFSLKADVKHIANEKGISEELAGREVRYGFFNDICKTHNIDCIATAHHRNDNAETIVMNFMRGSGLKGLCGIPYKRDNIIRPLLDCTRAEIEEYCTVNELSYVTDETNFEEEYTRNKIRNTLIPMIENKFNPSLVETISRNASVLSVEEDFISCEAERVYQKAADDNTLDIEILKGVHKAIALRVIRMMTDKICGNTDVSQAAVTAVYELMQRNLTGTKTDIVRDIEAHIEYGKLIIAPVHAKCDEFSYELKLGEKTYIPELGICILAEATDKYEKDGAEYFSIPDGSLLCIRNRRQGDTFKPSGMNGTKKLKQFMIDRKIPQYKRDSVGIFTVNDEIAWVMGYRRAEGYKFNGKGIKLTIL